MVRTEVRPARRRSQGWVFGLPLLLAFALSGMATLPRQAKAQDQPGGGATDLTVRDDKAEVKRAFGSLSGFSAYGATLGGMRMLGGDLAKGAQIRPLMQASFRYRFSDRWSGAGEFGMGWNSFADRGDSVATFYFGTVGGLRQMSVVKGAVLRAGGGVGMYRYNYKFKGKSILDPDTHRPYRGFVPGIYVGAEAERRMTRHVTLTGHLQQHFVFTAADRYKSLFDVNQTFLGFRFGLHYHFSPDQGIMWERKEVRKVRIESGKAGK